MNSSLKVSRLIWGGLLLTGLVAWSVLDIRLQLVFPPHNTVTRPAAYSPQPTTSARSIRLVEEEQEQTPIGGPKSSVTTAQFSAEESYEADTESEAAVSPLFDKDRVGAAIFPRKSVDEVDDSVAAVRPFELEAGLATWRNPFHPKLWAAPGWITITHGMQGTGAARFRKSYARLSLSLAVEAVDEELIPEPSLRLENEDDHTRAVTIHWNRETVTLMRERDGVGPTLIREVHIPDLKPRQEHPHRRQIQMIATGNRLIIAEAGRRLIFCDQPSEISGQSFRFTLNVGDQEVRLRDLRLDGE
ncbi:MAG: hypothetical protein ACKVT0_08615 [Planctomycetaceae bacterium]